MTLAFGVSLLGMAFFVSVALVRDRLDWPALGALLSLTAFGAAFGVYAIMEGLAP